MTKSTPILSIVVATRNQLNSLKFTLLTLRDQPPQVPHEIIVVNCGTEDESAQFLATQAKNHHLDVVTGAVGSGRTAARNQGAQLAQGKYLMFLDPGLVMGPLWSSSLLETLERDPMVGAVAGKVILPDGLIDHAGLAVLEMPVAEGRRLFGRSVHAGQKAEFKGSRRPLVVQGLAGEAMMTRASAFFGVGGFDEGMGREFDAVKPMAEGEAAGLDLSLRLGSRGWTCVYRHESIMTRLRVSEAEATGTSVMANRVVADDLALISANWLDKVRPDFIISNDGRVSPAETGFIRPYVVPSIAFNAQQFGGRVHPDRSLASGECGDVVASIVVLAQNSLAHTQRCAEALLEHTDARHELIFVDNASSDGTGEYLDNLAAGDPRVRAIALDTDQGLAGGYGVGLAAANGRHIVLLDTGAVVTDGWVECLIRAAEANPRAGLVGAVTNQVCGLQRLSDVAYDVDTLAGLADFAAQQATAHAGRVDHIAQLNGFCLLIKRELLARIGGLDAVFSGGTYEAQDYCLRSQLAGYECLIARDCFVHCTAQTASPQDMVQVHRQWSVFKAKWGVPAGTTFMGHVDINTLLAGGFDPTVHFCSLPTSDVWVREAVAACR